MANTKRVLAWSDSVLAPTGFGTVSRHVLAALHATGEYKIDQLAINYFGEFFDTKRYPYQLLPAKLLDPSDPFGNRQLVRVLDAGDYDLLWVLNDVNVVHGVVPDLRRLRAEKQSRGATVFKTVFYYPVDCTVWPRVSDMIRFADTVVTYTEWGRKQTLAALPDLKKPIRVIPHGVDAALFPLPNELRQRARAEMLGILDPSVFIVLNVNRNNVRKNIAQSILAFSEFRKTVPNSHLHLQTDPMEGGINLFQSCAHLHLRVPQDVSFPHPELVASTSGLPVEMLNGLYNAANVFLTTTLGEGWGLTITEAIAAGIPVVVPDHSAIPELLPPPGDDATPHYLYECDERVRVDNAGFRPTASTRAVVNQLLKCYRTCIKTPKESPNLQQHIKFGSLRSWVDVGQLWVDVFDRLSRLDDV